MSDFNRRLTGIVGTLFSIELAVLYLVNSYQF